VYCSYQSDFAIDKQVLFLGPPAGKRKDEKKCAMQMNDNHPSSASR
jgi:hypothetical protein